jgi:hypothetical protein
MSVISLRLQNSSRIDASFFGVSCSPLHTPPKPSKDATHLVQTVARLGYDGQLELALHLADDEVRVEAVGAGENEQLGRFNREELLGEAVEPSCVKRYAQRALSESWRTLPVSLGLV